jgi:CHAT domain-containing protein
LEYALGGERSYLWAVTPSSFVSYELPKRDEIEAAARRVYDLITARNQRALNETVKQRQARLARANAEYSEAAATLSRMILGPVAGQLENKRLLVVNEGALQFIPFAALPKPAGAELTTPAARPLVVDHEIVTLPSASTLAALRRETAERKPAPKTLWVLADPVFTRDDARVKRGASAKQAQPEIDDAVAEGRGFAHEVGKAAAEAGFGDLLRIPRLPFTRREAEGIATLVPAAARKQALDFRADRAAALSADLGQYRYVHFATHGFLNSVHPELSGILLSMVNEQGKPQEGFLRAHEVYNLNLSADLVVLSACQTGLGKEVKGEGLVGLTRGFMYAGAPRVVVSLWGVNDQATSELMVRFYRGMLKEGLRPAAALRSAQIEMWKNKRWSAPFYWAAFVQQGEWR